MFLLFFISGLISLISLTGVFVVVNMGGEAPRPANELLEKYNDMNGGY